MNSNDITPKKGMSLIIICKAELQVFHVNIKIVNCILNQIMLLKLDVAIVVLMSLAIKYYDVSINLLHQILLGEAFLFTHSIYRYKVEITFLNRNHLNLINNHHTKETFKKSLAWGKAGHRVMLLLQRT